MKITIDVGDLTSGLDFDDLATAEARKGAFKLQKRLKQTPPIGTPRDEGTARNGWDVDTSGPNPIVQNNVSYIGFLNDGHSSQSPEGFVEAAIDAIFGSDT